MNPQWVDRSQIVYQRSPVGDGQRAILELDLRSQEQREVVSGADLIRSSASATTFAPSPDGRVLAYVRMDKATKQGSLSLISLSGGPSRELVRFAPGKGIALSGWTPDGRSIVYVQASSQSDGAEAGSANTWMIPIDGGPARKIELNEEAGQLRVHPDGKQIAYWIPNRTPEQVWVLENLARKLPAR